MKKTVNIIAYGTLMTGEPNHRFCENAVRIRPCTIIGMLYDLHCGFPAFTTCGTSVVHAELIEIPIEDWPNIDRLEGYPRFYDRKLVSAKLADGSETEGWVYVMDRISNRATVIRSGSWKNK